MPIFKILVGQLHRQKEKQIYGLTKNETQTCRLGIRMTSNLIFGWTMIQTQYRQTERKAVVYNCFFVESRQAKRC